MRTLGTIERLSIVQIHLFPPERITAHLPRMQQLALPKS